MWKDLRQYGNKDLLLPYTIAARFCYDCAMLLLRLSQQFKFDLVIKLFMETEANVKDDVDDDHVDYKAQDKANESADELESTRESADELESAICFMWKNDSELTVDEISECFQAKSCKKVTSFPPHFPSQAKSTCLLVMIRPKLVL